MTIAPPLTLAYHIVFESYEHAMEIVVGHHGHSHSVCQYFARAHLYRVAQQRPGKSGREIPINICQN